MLKYKDYDTPVEDVKLIAGVLAASGRHLEAAKRELERKYGGIDNESGVVDFDNTVYYSNEMGNSIVRQFVAFTNLICPGRLKEIKIETNGIEVAQSVEGLRQVNIDPGYLTLASVVLASTKDASYRVYLGGGIYAQTTLFFKDKTFQPYEWTYKDYCGPRQIEFFNTVRAEYYNRIRK
jgi:Domain of unknown function (DUF4416)